MASHWSSLTDFFLFFKNFSIAFSNFFFKVCPKISRINPKSTLYEKVCVDIFGF